MKWENVLKRGGKTKNINFTVLRTVVEEIISDKDNFKIQDISEKVRERYIDEMTPIIGNRGRAKMHGNKLSTRNIGRIINVIETHEPKEVREYDKGKYTGKDIKIYRRKGEK